MRGIRIIERLAWGLGVLLLASYAGVRIHGAIGSRQAMHAFDAAAAACGAGAFANPDVDTRLWSDSRIKAYRATLEQEDGIPLALLRIPRIGLEVPVLDGTEEYTLNRGVGRIIGTARPGEPGNVGIAGHRDGFFRGLKDVSAGDLIELQTLSGTDTYEVTEITIVDPEQVDVLGFTAEPSLTLVTCYPFYFVGSAPRRYIVRATRQTVLSVNSEGQSAASAVTSPVQ